MFVSQLLSFQRHLVNRRKQFIFNNYSLLHSLYLKYDDGLLFIDSFEVDYIILQHFVFLALINNTLSFNRKTIRSLDIPYYIIIVF